MDDHDDTQTTVGRTEQEAATVIDTTTSMGERFSMPVLPTVDGEAFNLGSLRGKKVLLFMWGSW